METRETPNTEEELEAFRERWRSEVSSRSKSAPSSQIKSKPEPNGPGQPSVKLRPTAKEVPTTDSLADGDGPAYHDLENKEDYLKLENAGIRSKGVAKEPKSALEHYERAVERESQGKLGDSLSHYRRAFKLDASVQEAYKRKYFPSSIPTAKSTDPNPSNAPVNVPNLTQHLLDGTPQTISELIEEFSSLSIGGAEPEKSLSPHPPCPIARIPEEVLVEILQAIGQDDVATFGKLTLVCKRLAFLIMTEDRIWKPIAMGSEYGIRGMHYRYSTNLKGVRLHRNLEDSIHPAQLDLTPSVFPTYRTQFRNRTRVRFNGCYISTVNYTRPGGAHQSQFTWNNPVHIVTYYRYLRFFRDGTCISLLSTSEPTDVIHHLTKENMHRNHTGTLPSAVMKDALPGRWRLSGARKILPEEESFESSKGPGEYDIEPFETDEFEEEGILHVETEGVQPKYMWKLQFSVGSAGRKDGTRNNKLSWKGYWNYNRLTDDWGEFGLKNDRAYYWSRVKSY